MSLVPSESESKEIWIYLLKAMYRFYLWILEWPCCDRKKALKVAFLNVAHSLCCQHLADKVRLKWPTCGQRSLESGARQKQSKKFQIILNGIREHDPASYVLPALKPFREIAGLDLHSPSYRLSSVRSSSLKHGKLRESWMVKGKIHRNLMTSRITNYASTHLADEMREAGKYPATNYSNDKVMVQAPSETWKRRWGKRERVWKEKKV